MTGDVLLPPFGKAYYYERYTAQHPLGVEKETFLQLWRTLFPKMKVPSDQRLGMCRYCTEAKEKLELALTEADRDAIAKELQEHLLFIQAERAHYHNVRKEAKENPRYLFFFTSLFKEKTRVDYRLDGLEKNNNPSSGKTISRRPRTTQVASVWCACSWPRASRMGIHL